MRRPLVSHVAILAVATATGSWAQSTPEPAAAPMVVASTVKRASVPFGPGERMEYDVKFGALRVGSAHMEVVALDNMVRGRPENLRGAMARGPVRLVLAPAICDVRTAAKTSVV